MNHDGKTELEKNKNVLDEKNYKYGMPNSPRTEWHELDVATIPIAVDWKAAKSNACR